MSLGSEPSDGSSTVSMGWEVVVLTASEKMPGSKCSVKLTVLS